MPIPNEDDELRRLDEEQAGAMTPPGVQTMSATGTPASTTPTPAPAPVPGSDQGQENAGQTLWQYAQQGLANPSRFDSDVFQQGLGVINRETERSRDRGQSELDEFASSRGVVGSSIEGNARADMEAQLENDRLSKLWELSMRQAETFADDRQAAAQIGFQSGEFLRQLGYDRTMTDRWEREFGLAKGGQEFSQDLASKQFDLASGGQQFSQELALKQFGLAAGSQEFQQKVQQKALELQETGMDRDEAFRQASLSFEKEIQDRSLALQEKGIDQQTAIQYAQLEQDQRFRQIAADLQAKGMDLDEAYRQASLTWQQQYGTRQQDLQQQGMDDDYQLRLMQVLANFMGSSNIDADELRAALEQAGLTGGGATNGWSKGTPGGWANGTAPAPGGTSAAPNPLGEDEMFRLWQQLQGGG